MSQGPGAGAAAIGGRQLLAFCAAALRAAGAADAAAQTCAQSLVAADERGVHSHGSLRLGVYVDRLRAGSIDGRASPVAVRDLGAVAVLDGGAGLGIAVAAAAVDLAVERAGRHGVGVVGVRNSHHCGMLAWLVQRATDRGCAALAMSNADAQVAPWGARAKFMGTNPLAIGVPTAGQPFVVDFATSVVAHARIKAAAERGEAIPEGWALDAEGRPTTDPRLALAGALLPFGGPKGAGLSLMVELLAGLLPGGQVGPDIVPLYERLAQPQQVGHFFVVLDVAAFGEREAFLRRAAQTLQRVRELPAAHGVERVWVPGEIEQERAARAADAPLHLPELTWAELRRTAALLGLALPQRPVDDGRR
jgi:ureidoglycolate dehydrogenase (NAD+)